MVSSSSLTSARSSASCNSALTFTQKIAADTRPAKPARLARKAARATERFMVFPPDSWHPDPSTGRSPKNARRGASGGLFGSRNRGIETVDEDELGFLAFEGANVDPGTDDARFAREVQVGQVPEEGRGADARWRAAGIDERRVVHRGEVEDSAFKLRF